MLGVGPEALALLEAGEWGSAFANPDGELLLASYARALGLDQAVIDDWLDSVPQLAAARGALAAARGVDARKPPLSGPARFLLRVHPSTVPSPGPGPPGVPAARAVDLKPPALQLREARVRAGFNQEEAARLLGMRQDFVAAMDRGHLDRLPRGHERGMLTRYARLVGLDPALVLEGLLGHTRQARPEPPRRPRNRLPLWIRFSGGVLIVTGLVLAAISLS